MAKKLSGLRGRLEDVRLITGAGRFVDDINRENQAYLGMVRSPYAHAKIKKIDFSKVKSSTEFIACLTGEDLLAEGTRPLSAFPMQKPTNRYHLAVNRVRYAGEGVAAILVKNKYSVEDLIDDVEVEYEELPVVTTIEEAKKNSTLLYEDWKDNIALTSESKKGDAEKAIASAAHVVKTKLGIRRQAGVPIEPRATLVEYDIEKDIYEIHATVQSANRLQAHLSAELRVPNEKLHVRVMDVGGGFGTKGAQSYPEALISCLLSKRTGLPVKWISTRTEDLLETAAGRDEYCEMILACDENAKIIALKAIVESDLGVSGSLSRMGSLTLNLIPGAYKIPNLDLRAISYVTNKGPSGPVRGAGRPESSYFIERAVDMLSKKINIDPIEFRRKNIILPNEFPYDNGAGFVYDGANFPLLLDTVVESSNFEDLRKWKEIVRAKFENSQEKSLVGLGMSLEIEDTGAQLTESAKVVLYKNGHLTIFTGSSPHGQGLETTLAQLASRELGISLEMVNVVWGDTYLIPVGIGTFGSRSIATGGSSVLDASRKLKSQILSKAAEILGTEIDALDIRKASIVKKSLPNNSLLQLKQMMSALKIDDISATSDYKLSGQTFSSGAHLCALILDSETGKIKISKYVAVDDCGKVINEAIVNGQIHGGVVHGIGGAILEEIAYDTNGHMLTSNFLDYTIPSSMESPDIKVVSVETPSNITLSGAKGIGESGTIAAYPAVINALNDALSQMSEKIVFNIAPATPNAVISVVEGSS